MQVIHLHRDTGSYLFSPLVATPFYFSLLPDILDFPPQASYFCAVKKIPEWKAH
jgi:hypothetical protein